LLGALDKEAAKGRGLCTRKLLQEVDRTHNGQAAIKRAEQEVYIKRIRDVKPSSSGNHLVLNVITPKGQKLLDKLADHS
jgi:hypothetical protein